MRAVTIVVGVLAAITVMFLIWAHRPAIAAIVPPDPARFAAAEISRGSQLARIGNCVGCHQSAHGRPYAGGYGVQSPFGTIYGSNITPDPDTGIGRWSQAAFERAMREGVSRDGHHLYPAFPYDHFTRLHQEDLRALYAFLMTRQPVRSTVPANRLIPPLGFRPLIAGWKLLYFRPGSADQHPSVPVALRRGAYLGEALGHCGACHSPRGMLGNERRDHAYQGGWSDGWYAPPLDRSSPAVRAWTSARLATYLTTGLSAEHAAAAGPMGPVTRNLAGAPAADVAAIAGYYAWLMRDAPAARHEAALSDRPAEAARRFPEGATLFAGACAACHEPGAAMMVAGRPALALGSSLHQTNPRNTIQIILKGLPPPVRARGPYMPAYGPALDDRQVAALVGYLQARFGTGAAWNDLEGEVAKARKAGTP